MTASEAHAFAIKHTPTITIPESLFAPLVKKMRRQGISEPDAKCILLISLALAEGEAGLMLQSEYLAACTDWPTNIPPKPKSSRKASRRTSRTS